jgi:hypothetical protein
LRVGCLGRAVVSQDRVAADGFRETEVENLHATVGGDEDVLGFQVAMDNPLVMSRRQPVGDRRREIDGLEERQGTLRQAGSKRVAGQQLGDDVGSAAIVADVIERQDVGMRERRDRLGFSLEPIERGAVGCESRRQDLDRHLAIEPRIAGAIHLAHPAFANLGDDFVGSDSRACVHRRTLAPARRRSASIRAELWRGLAEAASRRRRTRPRRSSRTCFTARAEAGPPAPSEVAIS